MKNVRLFLKKDLKFYLKTSKIYFVKLFVKE